MLEVTIGSAVRLKKGAKTYSGGSLASFVYERNHQVTQLSGDRAVISYKGTVVAAVTFTNGEVIHRGDVVGDISEKDMRRVQIRETIKAHLEKEEELFNRGIKTLSLFFIDEVAKYRQYDEDGEEILGEYRDSEIPQKDFIALLALIVE